MLQLIFFLRFKNKIYFTWNPKTLTPNYLILIILKSLDSNTILIRYNIFILLNSILY